MWVRWESPGCSLQLPRGDTARNTPRAGVRSAIYNKQWKRRKGNNHFFISVRGRLLQLEEERSRNILQRKDAVLSLFQFFFNMTLFECGFYTITGVTPNYPKGLYKEYYFSVLATKEKKTV